MAKRLFVRPVQKYWPHGLLAIVFLYFAFPWFMDRFDLPAFEPQNKCPPDAIRPGGKPDPIKKIRPNPGEVYVIRLTNSGQFVDRCELTDALDELIGDQKLSFGPPWRKGAKDLPRLTLLYVHGWKHHDKSEDLERFKEFVRELQAEHTEKQVLGVYVAWNASWHLGWLDNLSFWSKETVADRIAESAVLTKILSALGAMRKKRFETADQFIAIGHSFGARLLFAASSHTLMYETQKAHPGKPGGTYSAIRGATDAIILLNPAFEASMYSALDGMHRQDESLSTEQPPLLLSVSSSGDKATGVLFPMGHSLGGRQTDTELTTLGNYKDFVTHQLTQTHECSGDNRSLSEEFMANGLCLKRNEHKARTERQSYNPFKLAKTKTEPPQRYNPFIIASTTDDIISDHNDIWNKKFRMWLIKFIEALEVKHHDAPEASPGTNYRADRVPEDQLRDPSDGKPQ